MGSPRARYRLPVEGVRPSLVAGGASVAGMTTPLLRAATPADLPGIVRVWSAGWAEAHGGRVPRALELARTPESWEPPARERLSGTWVADVDGEVAGLVVVDGDEVDQLYVDAAHRGSGVAAALLSAGERLVREAGHDRAWLAVLSSNDRARRFYARQGWADEGAFEHRADGGDGRTVGVECHRYAVALAHR